MSSLKAGDFVSFVYFSILSSTRHSIHICWTNKGMLWKIRCFGHSAELNFSWLFADSYWPKHNFSYMRNNLGINLRVSANSKMILLYSLLTGQCVWFLPNYSSCSQFIFPKIVGYLRGFVTSISRKGLDNHRWDKRRKGCSIISSFWSILVTCCHCPSFDSCVPLFPLSPPHQFFHTNAFCNPLVGGKNQFTWMWLDS